MSLTRQEMFDRAVRGLASQNWVRCVDAVGICMYTLEDGKHCAWGWVDPSLPVGLGLGDVGTLRARGIGVAGTLPKHDLLFACSMQSLHDRAVTRVGMRDDFVEFGKKHGLIWPSDVP